MLMLAGDRVMLPGEPVRDTGGILSFAEEAALGRHISGRSVDIRDESRLILRSFVPVVQNGGTVAMLCGVVDLETLPAPASLSFGRNWLKSRSWRSGIC